MKLGELISRRQADLGLSLERLAKRARDEGLELTKTTLSQFKNHGLTESPKRRTMEALAAALDVTYPEVVLAVAQSMAGDDARLVEVTDQQHVRSWLTLTEGRSDDDRNRREPGALSIDERLDQLPGQKLHHHEHRHRPQHHVPIRTDRSGKLAAGTLV